MKQLLVIALLILSGCKEPQQSNSISRKGITYKYLIVKDTNLFHFLDTFHVDHQWIYKTRFIYRGDTLLYVNAKD
jgi:hypothetical protein